MSQINRLPEGGRLNTAKPITFHFNGHAYYGYPGDTLASALLANGVDVVTRSFKYSRPRGIFGSGSEEPNAILQIGDSLETSLPNQRATQTELYDGLVVNSVNGWPNLDTDLMETVGKIGGAMMPAGFYYKTFMYPESLWPTYEKYIRKAAGTGKVPGGRDPDRYDKMHHHCEVLIVGGGPAGLMAARSLCHAGIRVILADEQQEFGGSLLSTRQTINNQPAADWVTETLSLLSEDHNFTLLPRSTVFGYYDQNFLGIVERLTDHLGEDVHGIRQRVHHVRAGKVILATGAIERPLVFGNNDVPGCMLASAVSTYIRRYAVVPGHRLVVMTANDAGYSAALDWNETGREVAAIVDTRAFSDGELVEQAKAAGIRILHGHAVFNVRGEKRVSGAEVVAIDKTGTEVIGTIEVIPCDTVASAGGWSPALHLSCHTGSRPVWREDITGFVPAEDNPDRYCIGAVGGQYSLSGAFEDALAATQDLSKALKIKRSDDALEIPEVHDPVESDSMALFHIPHFLPASRAPKQFVDFQTDVTAAAIELATREGYESIEHVKRYTALGFGTDQGKTSNINGMAIAAKALGQSIPDTGTTIFRPMYTPVTFGALAGRDAGHLFDPTRFTAMHKWHLDNGAEFENVGQWKRPWYYPRGDETMEQALNRECLATRTGVGILDASTLGKIDIQGKDAREFLNRIYTNGWDKLAPGRCRYGLMCHEDGMIFDDGVTSCINDNHFLMTTTTGGAAGVLQWLELWHQTEWPEMELFFTSVTDHWATMTISGPNSRDVLQKLVDDVDLSEDAFPFMSWIPLVVAGVEARVFRISFTGELSFEINVNANVGMFVWQQVMVAGEEFNITPYGTETMHILRAEKGFIIAGQDTDGSVTPQDMDMGWITGKKKTFSYIGRRSWLREDNVREDRKQFVGLKSKDPQQVIPEGSQAVNDPQEPVPMTMVGHVSSSYFSVNLGYSIALGLIKGGQSRVGESVYFPQADGTVIEAEITSPVFYDVTSESAHNIEPHNVAPIILPGAPSIELPLHHVGVINTSSPSVHLHEVKDIVQINLRGDGSRKFANAVKKVTGLALPTKACQSSEDDKYQIWWLSPNEWLLIANGETATGLEASLRKHLPENTAVTDVTGGLTLLRLTGSHAAAVLKKSTSYDVDEGNFPIGKCVGTTFAQTQVFLRHQSEMAFELVVRRSFSDYIWLWIQDAAEEYGLGVDC